MTTSVDRLAKLASLPASRFHVDVDHVHVWERLADTVGFFQCRSRKCPWCAVCPGCLGSLDVALQVEQGIGGLQLLWCSSHFE